MKFEGMFEYGEHIENYPGYGEAIIVRPELCSGLDPRPNVRIHVREEDEELIVDALDVARALGKITREEYNAVEMGKCPKCRERLNPDLSCDWD